MSTIENRVIAFDIDGALTTREGMRLWNEQKDRAGHTLGIVSARNEDEIEQFIQDSNISPEFTRSTRLKGVTLSNMKDEFDADEFLYVGSWTRDRLAAVIGGWEYQEL